MVMNFAYNVQKILKFAMVTELQNKLCVLHYDKPKDIALHTMHTIVEE